MALSAMRRGVLGGRCGQNDKIGVNRQCPKLEERALIRAQFHPDTGKRFFNHLCSLTPGALRQHAKRDYVAG